MRGSHSSPGSRSGQVIWMGSGGVRQARSTGLLWTKAGETRALPSQAEGCLGFSQWLGQALHRGGLPLPQKCSHKTGPEGRFQRRAQDCESGHSTPEKTNGVGAPAAAQQVCACVDGRGPLHTAPRGSWSLDVGTRSTCSQVGMSIQPHCARV